MIKLIMNKIALLASLTLLPSLSFALDTSSDKELFDPRVDGMELRLSDINKTINIELPDGEFLELRLPVPYFEPPIESFVLLRDIKSLEKSYNNLLILTELPIQEYIQPSTQEHIKTNLNNLKLLLSDLESRLYAFTLSEAELIELSQKSSVNEIKPINSNPKQVKSTINTAPVEVRPGLWTPTRPSN